MHAGVGHALLPERFSLSTSIPYFQHDICRILVSYADANIFAGPLMRRKRFHMLVSHGKIFAS